MKFHLVQDMFSERSAGIPKAPTGIRGMDEILLGGRPRVRTTLLTGGPGTGSAGIDLARLGSEVVSSDG